MTILVVMIGGAFGALTRYGAGLWLGRHLQLFPLATLTVNIIGALMLSILVTVSERYGGISPLWRAGLATGYLGALTTFSTFEVESAALIRSGNGLGTTLYVLGNLVLGYGAVLLGRWMVLGRA
ncbi:MAG: fluoride efflux transporter CrcB [Deinococcota bacterium]